MDRLPEPVKATLLDEIFPDGGEMGQLMRSHDWSATPLGPADKWPQSLRTSVSICLASRFPILIWWGPELIKIYNDAYRPILGATKHPQALGQPGRDCWPEIWDIIGPMLSGVREEGKATWSDDSMLPLDRNGFLEECYFTFSYSPIRDETGAVGGVFTAVTETTRRVLGERRLRTLRDLAANTTEAKTVEEACAIAANTLLNNTADIPFALLYLLDANSSGATLAATTNCKDSFCESLGFAATIAVKSDEEDKPIAKLLAQVAETNKAHLLHISDLKLPIEPEKFQSQISNLKSQIQSVLILPVARSGKDRPAGILVAGISPFLSLDEDYRGFFELVAGQVATAAANARAYEQELQRSSALAELYRANLKMARIRSQAARRERAARIEAEAAHEKLSHILESIADGFVAFDREWRYTYLNKKAAESLRKSQEEVLGKSIWEVFPDAISGKYYTELHRARAEQIPVHFEYYYPPLDSWFENDAYPTADGISVFGRDISDRKRAQAEREQMIELLESEQALLEAVLQQMPAAAIVAEAPSGKLLLGNKLVEKIWRQPFLEADTIGQYRIYQGFHLDGQPYEAEEWPLARSIRNGEVITEEEINFQRGDGSYGTMRVSSTPIYNYKGAIVAGVMTFYDITSSKRAKEELRASEEKFRTLVNSMQDIVFTLDREQRFTGVFGSWLEKTGFQAEFFWGKTPQEIYEWQSSDLRLQQSQISNLKLPAAIHEAGHKKALSGETVVYEWSFQSVNGTEYCQTSLSPLRDANGEIIGVVGVGRDITQLHRGKEVQRFLAEASKVLTATLDYETTLKSVARLAVPYLADYCVIFVLEEEDRIRRVAVAHRDAAKEALLKELQAYPLDLNSEAPVAQVLRKRQPLLVREVSESIWAAISSEVNQDRILRELDPKSLVVVPLVARGRMLGAIAFTYAESGRRYQPSDLALAEDLAYRAALAFSLAQLYRKAQEANRIKDEFLAIVSHELRTPLNAILGWATLLRTRKFDEARTASALETIERNARMQSQLIEDLLDVSRMLRDKLSLDLRPLDLVTAIEAATETVRPTAQNKNIELKLILCDRGCLVSADFNRLQQVVWNLLSNAIKFTPPGGRVEIGLSINFGSSIADFGLENTPLESNSVALKKQPTNPKSRYAQISVSDTGKGISPNFLPYVFDRFRQADSTTTREQGGLGLGLAIVRHLVELHGGTVSVASDGEGKGATFTVKLPLLEAIEERRLGIENSRVPSPQSPVPSPLSGLRILVVDDEADTRDFLTTALEQYGAKVIAADSTESALEALQEWKADVLVSDIGMPGEDGYALIGKVRALESERGRSLPAVALTAYAMETDRSAALSAGFQRHLSKPIDPIELVSAIEQLVKTKS